MRSKIKGCLVSPLVNPSPGSLDLRAGKLYTFKGGADGNPPSIKEVKTFEQGGFIINSSESVLIRTEEKVNLFSSDTTGLILNKSSIARKGLAVATQLIEFGHNDHVLLTLTNVNRFPQKVFQGDKITQLALLSTDKKSEVQTCLQTCSLTLGNEISIFKSSSEIENIPIAEGYSLSPGEFILGISQEKVALDSHGVIGILTHTNNCFYNRIRVLEGLINPGFKGKIVIEIKNSGNNPIRLEPGMEMYKVRFVPAQTFGDYSSFLGSKYVGDIKTSTPQL